MTENWVIHDVVEDYLGQEITTTIYVVERILVTNTGFPPIGTLVTSFLLENKAKELVSIANAWCREKRVGGVTISGYPVIPTGSVVSGSIGAHRYLTSGIATTGSPVHLTSGNPYYAPVPDPRESLVCPYDPGFRWSAGVNIHYAYKFVELRF